MFKGDSEAGQFRYQWHGVSNGNILLVANVSFGGKEFLDSAVVKRRGLAPIWESAYLVLRSLPLRDGYEAILPLYSEGSDTVKMDSVTVVNHDAAAGVWTLRFADPAIVATYDIDERTRKIVGRRQTARKSGVQYRFVQTY